MVHLEDNIIRHKMEESIKLGGLINMGPLTYLIASAGEFR